MSENNEIINGEEIISTDSNTAPETVETVATAVEEVVEETTVDETAETAQPTPAASEDEDEVVYDEPVFDEGFLGTCERALYKAWKWIKKVLHIPDMSKKQRAMIWDKITTGILIALFATPIAVLIYILLWFVFRNV